MYALQAEYAFNAERCVRNVSFGACRKQYVLHSMYVVAIAVMLRLASVNYPTCSCLKEYLERLLAYALQVIILHTVYLYSKYKFKSNSVSGVFIII